MTTTLEDEAMAATDALMTECDLLDNLLPFARVRLVLAMAWCEGRAAGLKVGEGLYTEAMDELKASL